MTNQYRFYFVTNIALIVALAIITASCSNDDNGAPVPVEPTTNGITDISEEIKNLIYFQGEEQAPTVLITVPGGPSTEFGTDIVDTVFESFDTTDMLTVTVHQAQTLDSTVVKGTDLSLEQAVDLNDESIAMLDEVMSYFKGQGRTVYLFGLSFGAFITQEMIAKNGIDSADKYLIITGRLDMDQLVWEAAAEGREACFENGLTPKVAPEPDPDVKERNLNRISAGYSRNRYTELFAPITDLSSVTYVYGAMDEAVGRLSEAEVAFLESKNTNLFEGPGDHTETLEGFFLVGLETTFDLEARQ